MLPLRQWPQRASLGILQTGYGISKSNLLQGNMNILEWGVLDDFPAGVKGIHSYGMKSPRRSCYVAEFSTHWPPILRSDAELGK